MADRVREFKQGIDVELFGAGIGRETEAVAIGVGLEVLRADPPGAHGLPGPGHRALAPLVDEPGR